MATIKKYNGSTWENAVVRKYGTASEIITPPTTIYADGTAISTYSLKGNTTQSGTPTPSNPVEVQGVGNKTANLFDNANATIYNAYINRTESKWVADANNRSIRIPCEGNTQYTISVPNSLSTFRIADTTDIDPNPSNQPTVTTLFNENNASHGTFTTSAGAKWIIFQGTANSVSEWVAGLMFNLGSTVMDYEPYGQYKIPISSGGVTNNIYLNEPLYKIGDTTDSVSSSGTVTYNIGWIDLGTLGWETTASGNFHSTTIIADMKMITNNDTGNAVCTEFSEVDALSVANVAYSFSSCLNNQRTPIVNKTGFEGMTAAQFKAAMSGVIMYYVKAEATTETITAPTIPTVEGANSITVDTTVQPSEFTATWTGWHDASVKEKSENLTSTNTWKNADTTDTRSYFSARFYVSGGVQSFANVTQIGEYTLTLTGLTNETVQFKHNGATRDIRIFEYTCDFSEPTDLTVSFYANGYNPTELNGIDLTDIMLNEGSTAQTYEPYWK